MRTALFVGLIGVALARHWVDRGLHDKPLRTLGCVVGLRILRDDSVIDATDDDTLFIGKLDRLPEIVSATAVVI